MQNHQPLNTYFLSLTLHSDEEKNGIPWDEEYLRQEVLTCLTKTKYEDFFNSDSLPNRIPIRWIKGPSYGADLFFSINSPLPDFRIREMTKTILTQIQFFLRKKHKLTARQFDIQYYMFLRI